MFEARIEAWIEANQFEYSRTIESNTYTRSIVQVNNFFSIIRIPIKAFERIAAE